MAVVFKNLAYKADVVTETWLSGWGKRIKLTIDNTDIDGALSDFPILVYLSTSSGRNNDDVSAVFDELTSDGNRKKIAITTSNGITECYVEIEKWDDANEKAWLWVKVPSVASGVDTELYLYYDVNHADNTDRVGDPNSTPAENVWDSNFKLVCHMQDDPDTSNVRDSTSNNNDGSKIAAGNPAEADGQIGKAQDFDGNDNIDIADAASLQIASGGICLEVIIEADIVSSARVIVWRELATNADGGNFGLQLVTGKLQFQYNPGAGDYQAWRTNDIVIAVDTYYHVLVTLTFGTAASIKLYVNGIEKAGSWTTGDGTTLPWSGAGETKIGKRKASGFPQYFDGIIDEVRIHDTTRSPAWIKASYESGRDDLLDFGSEEVWVVAHKTTHQNGGGDEIDVVGLSGLLADDQHVLDAEVTNVAVSKTLMTTRGDIIYRNATVPARLAKGTEGYVLTQGADDPAWAAATGGGGARLTVTHFQANPATGTMTDVVRVSDGATGPFAVADSINEYAEILFDAVYWVTQYRHYGNSNHVGDGRWKLQVLNPANDTWEDWITGIPIRTSDDWSGFTSNGMVLAAGIRLVCTTVDSYAVGSLIHELEVKY